MYITNKDFDTIAKALALLPEGNDFEMLDAHDQEIIISADTVMLELCKKKKADNQRIASYIADKRKTNKNYAR